MSAVPVIVVVSPSIVPVPTTAIIVVVVPIIATPVVMTFPAAAIVVPAVVISSVIVPSVVPCFCWFKRTHREQTGCTQERCQK